jgi:nitric oxide reductase NorD protein
VLDEGTLLPEWDWRRQCLLPNHCRIHEMLAADAAPCPLPAPAAHRPAPAGPVPGPGPRPHLAARPARRTGGRPGRLAALRRRPPRRRQRQTPTASTGACESGARDLACLLLADLSLSTDTWVDDHARVIDAIRDSLFLFAESLAATGDRFGMLGFSSRRRDPVRVHTLKGFDERYGPRCAGASRPSARLLHPHGGGIRHAAKRLLAREPAGRRLLLILSDGKPNDLDKYEGRYGIEDTRQAVREARRQGLEPFCVTIDDRGNDYLPHLFGSGGYVVIRRPSELPARLPLLYARLTAASPPTAPPRPAPPGPRRRGPAGARARRRYWCRPGSRR